MTAIAGFTLWQQLWQLMMMTVFGWLVMLAAQLLGQVNQQARWSSVAGQVGDFCFAVLVCLTFWLWLMAINGGLLRSYIVFGLAAGMACYQLLFRARLEQLCVWMARLLLGLCRLVLLPVALLRHISRGLRSCLPKPAVNKQETVVNITETD